MKNFLTISGAVGLALLAATAPHVSAQRPIARDTIRGAVVEVYQTYTPDIKLPPKPAVTPTLPPVETARTPQTLDVPQQTLHYTYRALPLRPLALGRDTTPLPPQNFVRAGGGTRETAFGEIGIGSLKTEFLRSNIYARHLSQSGPMRYQSASNTDGRVEAESDVLAGHTLKGGISATHNRYGYYGYDRARLPADVDLPRIRYTGLRAQASIASDSGGIMPMDGLRYGATAGASLYGTGLGAREQGLALAVNGSYGLEQNLVATLEIATALTSRRATDGGTGGNNFFAIRPAVQYSGGDASARVGLYPTVGMGGTLYVLPDVWVKYRIPESPVHLTGGWDALLWRNTLEELSTRNPFVDPDFPLRQTRSDEVYGRVDAALGRHFSTSLKGGWRQWRGLPLFVNRIDNTSFFVVHDPRVDAVQLEVSLRYAVGESFSVGASGQYTSFYKHTLARVWHEPGVRLSADASARPLRGLNVGASLTYLDRIAAPDRNGLATWLRPVADVGLRGEYDLTDRLGAFARVDNLFNVKYERWRGYPAFGITLWGGLRYKF